MAGLVKSKLTSPVAYKRRTRLLVAGLLQCLYHVLGYPLNMAGLVKFKLTSPVAYKRRTRLLVA